VWFQSSTSSKGLDKSFIGSRDFFVSYVFHSRCGDDDAVVVLQNKDELVNTEVISGETAC
jgi:hypothetical protein